MAGAYNISVDGGATWAEVWTWLDASLAPVDLTGYAAKMDWRTADGALVRAFSAPSAGVSLGGASGLISLSATAAQTAALPLGHLYYDLVLTSPGGVATRLLAGVVVVSPMVTQ